MSRNRAKRGTIEGELIEQLEQAVRAALASEWDLGFVVTNRPDEPDARFTITAPDGSSATVLVEAKRLVEPRDVARVANQLRHYGRGTADPAMLATSFVSPLTRDRLTEAGIGWFDTVGNLRLRINRPSVLIDRIGGDRNPTVDPADRRLKTLRGPGSARVVRALCEIELPVGVRALAARSHVAAATGARVLDLLDREAVIGRDDRGEVVSVRKRSLLRRWTDDYGLSTSNEVMAAIDPRGLDRAVATLPNADERHIVTGSAALRAYLPSGVVPVAPLKTLIVYAENPSVLSRQMGWQKSERGSNVLVVRPMDRVVFENGRIHQGMSCVAPAQAVADLLTGPGRSSEEAAQLLDVLAAGDRSWAN